MEDFPVATAGFGMTLVAASSQVVYSFGASDNNGPVYKYSRREDKWTPMPDMPQAAGLSPVCAKVTRKDRSVILCMGGRNNPGVSQS